MSSSNLENIQLIDQPKNNGKKMSLLRQGILSFMVLLVLVSLFFLIKVGLPLARIARRLSLSPQLLVSFIKDEQTLKNNNGWTNFLVMGAGGATHEGPHLTDSIMFVSINRTKKEAIQIFLPRDIWDDTLGGKINSAYALGEYEEGNGVDIARQAVARIIGQPIHYTVVIEFNAFKEMIDAVGGIDVIIDRSFDDYKYPLENEAYEAATVSGQIYETLHFEKGLAHLDGSTALKFARSRNSLDPEEGNDFARSKRQQKIMIAFKNKLMSFSTLTDFNKLEKIYLAVYRNMDTDIISKDWPGLARLGLSLDSEKITTIPLDEGTSDQPGFLINPPAGEYEAWVLVPRSGNWQEFQDYIKTKMDD